MGSLAATTFLKVSDISTFRSDLILRAGVLGDRLAFDLDGAAFRFDQKIKGSFALQIGERGFESAFGRSEWRFGFRVQFAGHRDCRFYVVDHHCAEVGEAPCCESDRLARLIPAMSDADRTALRSAMSN